MLDNLTEEEIKWVYQYYLDDNQSLDLSPDVLIEIHMRNLHFNYGRSKDDSRSP